MNMTKFVSCLVLALMILLCFVLGEASSAKTGSEVSEHGKSAAEQLLEYFHHRKMLLDIGGFKQEKASLVVHDHEASSISNSNNGGTETMDDWELRRAPAGPDPMHHNGNSPKNPRSAP